MGQWSGRQSVSFLALSVAIAAQSTVAPAAQNPPPGEIGAVPAAGEEVTEPQPASLAPPNDDEPNQEVTRTIVVTGSRIPRPNLTAVSPITVVGQEEVQLEGAIMAEELLNQLPQVAPSQGAFISNGATGTATVDLRDLGPPRTLVLVNGRRLGPGDPQSPVADLNIIPTTLIQRVEVITGGATSVYGSDAVSGVVNFILDTRLDGLRVDGQASIFQHNNRNESGLRAGLIARGFYFPTGNTVDGARQDINAAYGRGFFDGSVHVTVYAGYRKLEELRQDKRDYSACSAEVSFAGDSLGCGGSPASYPGNFITNFRLLTIGPDRTFAPGPNPAFNFGPWNFYQRPGRRWTAGGFADAEISEAVKPYLEVMYLNDRSTAQIAPSATFGNVQNINCDNPLLSDQQRALVCFEGNFVGQAVLFDNSGNVVEIRGTPTPFIDPATGATYFRGNLRVARRAVESGGRQSELAHKTNRLLGGVRGDLGRGITYDASYVRSRVKSRSVRLNDFSVPRLRRSTDIVTDPSTGQPVCRSVLTGADPDCVPWDIFGLGAITPEALAYVNVPSFTNGAVTEQIANANATVDLSEWGLRFPWSDEAPAINFGAEYRKNRLDFEPDELAQRGELAGSPTQIAPIHGSTEVKELFAEARVPLILSGLVERLALEGGYRQSWYSTGEAGFTTRAHKLALDLHAVRGLRFRAAQQRAVRAPNIIELFDPPVTDFFFHDPCAGVTPQATSTQCALTGVTAAQYGSIIPTPQSFFPYNAIGGGNPDLKPELATTRTIGVVFEPRFLRGLSATVDWWDIRLKGAVERVDGDTIIDTCIQTGDPAFCSRIYRDDGGSLWLTPEGFIDTRLFNIGSIDVRGLDVGAHYRLELGRIGSATIDFLGSYLDRYSVDNGGLSRPFDCAGKFGSACGDPNPRWRHKARFTWEGRQGLSLSFHWRYTGRTSLKPLPDFPPPGPLIDHLPAASFFDLSALFRVQRRFVFRLGVNNIFDREPPILGRGDACSPPACNGNTFPQFYDPLGRFFFAGFRVNL